MKNHIKILIGIMIAAIGLVILINYLYNEDKADHNEEPLSTSVIKEVEIITQPSSTTTTTTTTTKKTTKKTTVKTTTKKKNEYKFKNVETSSKEEYLKYAKEYGNLNDIQLNCLDYLWTRESNWNPNSVNSYSGACGIPQSYPCKKIKEQQGSYDWQAQIRWGLNYIMYRYKNPCKAWNHWKNHKNY